MVAYLTQRAFQWFADGTEAGSVAVANANVAPTVQANTLVLLRLAVDAQTGCTVILKIRVSDQLAGPYLDLGNLGVSGYGGQTTPGGLLHDIACTNRLSASGTWSNIGRTTTLDNGQRASAAFATGTGTNFVFSLQIGSIAGVRYFRVVDVNGTTLGYTQTASIAIAAASSASAAISRGPHHRSMTMFKKNTAVTGFVIGSFLNAATMAEVTSGTVTATRCLDGTSGACANAANYDSTLGAWKINLSAADLNGDLIGLKFSLASCLPITYLLKTVTAVPDAAGKIPAKLAAGDYQGNTPQTGDVYPLIGTLVNDLVSAISDLLANRYQIATNGTAVMYPSFVFSGGTTFDGTFTPYQDSGAGGARTLMYNGYPVFRDEVNLNFAYVADHHWRVSNEYPYSGLSPEYVFIGPVAESTPHGPEGICAYRSNDGGVVLQGTATPQGTVSSQLTVERMTAAAIAQLLRERLDGTTPIAAASLANVPVPTELLAAIRAKTDLISTGGITVVSPLSAGGEVLTLVVGDDYFHAHGRAIDFLSDDYPDLAGASCLLRILSRDTGAVVFSLAGTIVDAKTLRFEIPRTETAKLTPAAVGTYVYSSRVIFADGQIATEKRGQVLVLNG
jgi:hypothetical protein